MFQGRCTPCQRLQTVHPTSVSDRDRRPSTRSCRPAVCCLLRPPPPDNGCEPPVRNCLPSTCCLPPSAAVGRPSAVCSPTAVLIRRPQLSVVRLLSAPASSCKPPARSFWLSTSYRPLSTAVGRPPTVGHPAAAAAARPQM